MTSTAAASQSKLQTLIHAVCADNAHFSKERLQKAVDLVEKEYVDMEYWTGWSVLEHTAGTLEQLLQFEPDEDAIVTCMLMHLLRTKDWTLMQIEAEFGPKIRSLMSDAHILSHVTLQGQRMTLHDLRLMLVSVAHDVRTILINLASLVYVSTRITELSKQHQRQFCRDILQLFAPVAARLGIYSVKQELESGAFPILYEADFERIAEQYEQLFAEYGHFFEDSAKQLEDYLHSKGITCRVLSRQKLPYSVFMKMREKGLTHITSIPDLFAIRVIVPAEADCYQALGLLHQYAKPVPHRFKDYIAFPKPNGYQSLHTTLVNVPGAPEKTMIEVQVRTNAMHREAEYGIAAHWSYKEVGSTKTAMQSAQLNRILSAQETIDDGVHQTFANHIFVLTPKGDILELPEGATPLDFAFMVHSDLGLAFKGARVNGQIVSLDYILENGDVVEVMKHNTPQPTAQWMQVAKTSSARSKLKRYLYAQERPELIAQGKKLLNEQLRRRDLPLLDAELSVLTLLDNKKLTLTEREDVLVKIGQGSEPASAVFSRLPTEQQNDPEAELIEISVKTTVRRTVVLEDNMTMPYKFAKCCKAEEARGQIAGLVARTGSVMIHRKSCSNFKKSNASKRVEAKFS